MEPETVATGAGFRLDRWLRDHFYAGRIDDWMPMILAIEAEARAAAVAPVLEALREKVAGQRIFWEPGPGDESIAQIDRDITLRHIDALLSALPLRPSGEPEPGGLDVERLARALSCWSAAISGEGDPEFVAWAAQMIRSYLRTGGADE